MKARTLFLPLVALIASLILYLAIADIGKAHRVSGRPEALKGKLRQAKRQVAHDRYELAALRTKHWTLIAPLDLRQLSHRAWLRLDVAHVRRLERRLRPPGVLEIICRVFGPYCAQAQRVALCEGGRPVPSVDATNGQYLGIFQMGSYARSRYGHGPDAWTQARAAYRYFVESGRDWSPWACKP